jgi:ABC-type Zn2+ transport system substrate-binding protein/surface adhesin
LYIKIEVSLSWIQWNLSSVIAFIVFTLHKIKQRKFLGGHPVDDVEPIDQNQYQELEDERDDCDTEWDDAERDDRERDDAEPDEVHMICDPEGTQEGSTPQTSQASSSDLSQELDKPSQLKLQKFQINTNFPSKKTRSFNASWYNRFDWLEYNEQHFAFLVKMLAQEVLQTSHLT